MILNLYFTSEWPKSKKKKELLKFDFMVAVH